MTDKILDISEGPASLSVRFDQLVIRRGQSEAVSVPLAELGVLVVSHPATSFTHAVIAGLIQKGGAFVACDEKHMPIGMVLPLEGHFAQVERFALQARATLPQLKRIWQQVVKAKVRAQAALLEDLHGGDYGLRALARKVQSGDTGNVEAQASRRYWPALFQDPDFRRDRAAPDQNRFLNYGYAVLRSIVARAICASGLHPSLGVHHHNRYSAFCLADDLMEPYRPIIDGAVVEVTGVFGADHPVDKTTKAALLEVLLGRVDFSGDSRTLFDAATRTASSLATIFSGQKNQLVYPD